VNLFARIFDKFGTVIANDEIVKGSDIEVFGLALPDLTMIDAIKLAFFTADNEVNSEITITVVSGSFSGNVCVDVSEADMFLLSIIDSSVSSQ